VIAYLDSSAIVRQYLTDEGGTADLAATPGIKSLATARLSYVEVRAALAAARRGARLDSLEHDRAVASFDAAWAAFLVLELTQVVSERAGIVAEAYGLRAGDAIQLASVLELDLDETVLVAWDSRLRLAARAAGVASLPLGA
jgi:uncharacterized protein